MKTGSRNMGRDGGSRGCSKAVGAPHRAFGPVSCQSTRWHCSRAVCVGMANVNVHDRRGVEECWHMHLVAAKELGVWLGQELGLVVTMYRLVYMIGFMHILCQICIFWGTGFESTCIHQCLPGRGIFGTAIPPYPTAHSRIRFGCNSAPTAGCTVN